jgi:ParB-like nuclease domain
MLSNEQEIRLLPEEPNTDADFRWIELSDLPRLDDLGPPKPTKDLLESIRNFGIRQPVALVELTDRFDVIGGRRRIQAAWILYKEWEHEQREESVEDPSPMDCPYWRVPAMVGQDPEGMHVLDVQLNSTAKPNEFAYLDSISEMVREGADFKQIAHDTGLPIGTVKRLWNVQVHLHPEIKAAARQGRIRFSVAESASKLTEEQQVGNLLPVLREKEKITGTDVTEAKRAYHAKFADVDLGLGDLPGFEDVQGREMPSSPDSVVDLRISRAKEHLSERLGKAAEGKRMQWTGDDLDAVEALLEAVR